MEKIIEKVATMVGKLPSHERPKGTFTDPKTAEYHLALIYDYSAHGQISSPLVVDKAKGSFLWDVTGKKYLDFMSSFGCANQGHGHPKIIDALTTQAQSFALNSIAASHSLLGPTCKHLTERLGYQKILLMNSGAEAVDTAVLTARRWGYEVKKVPEGKAAVLFPKNCYWGMLSSSRAGSDLSMLREEAEPLGTDAQHYDFVGFDDVEALEAKFKANPNICAYIFEPIQGTAGNIHPKPGYYAKVRQLCTQYNVLMVSDEVQAGLGRTGKLFTCDWEGVRPDMITIGKALGADFLPISGVLADDAIMNVWSVSSHRSTYAGNTLACAVAVAAVDVLFDEKLIENAEKMGKIVEQEFNSYNYSFITQKFCGKGLFNALEIKDMLSCLTVCKYLLENGVYVLAETPHLKVMPPLTISETELREGLRILRAGLDDYDKKGKLSLVV